MVEQRPFKALVVGSSPTQPTKLGWPGYIFFEGLAAVTTSDRPRIWIGASPSISGARFLPPVVFGQPLELVVAREMPDVGSARILERQLKAKKNPQVAIYLLEEGPDAVAQW